VDSVLKFLRDVFVAACELATDVFFVIAVAVLLLR
jgi:hypothetical protein